MKSVVICKVGCNPAAFFLVLPAQWNLILDHEASHSHSSSIHKNHPRMRVSINLLGFDCIAFIPWEMQLNIQNCSTFSLNQNACENLYHHRKQSCQTREEREWDAGKKEEMHGAGRELQQNEISSRGTGSFKEHFAPLESTFLPKEKTWKICAVLQKLQHLEITGVLYCRWLTNNFT